MDEQPWEEFGELADEMFEQDVREDEYIISQHQSAKRPHPSPSLPPTYVPDTPMFPSHGKFQSHIDHAVNRGPLCSPSSVVSSASASSLRHTHTTTSMLSHPSSHTSSCMDTEMQDVQGQVQSLTNGMSYIYTTKAAASEYKIAKVNANRHQHDIEFQCKQADKEWSEAAIVHQYAQEAKSLELQVLEAKKAALQLEIELVKLKGGATSG
ncbi:hypothetical protein DFH29DRAFT_995236 [Suillus ampliporus]|nr:hypothetical protein DFH29DRAFT_995236 [Suillus ampliporus]